MGSVLSFMDRIGMGETCAYEWLVSRLIAKALSMIFEKSWQPGEVPAGWKKGKRETWY